MVTAGIIAEYNPFHSGHFYHIEQTRKLTEADAVVCVMSGSFVQRGEAAVLDKWTRARAALLCGADLVIELPFCFCAQSAEFFAKGGVLLLEALGLVDYLSFGSEEGELGPLDKAAEALAFEGAGLSEGIKAALRSGVSYPAARSAGLGGLGDALGQPNNILAVEYLKAIKRYGCALKPVTVKRQGAGYNELEAQCGFISATGARELIFGGNMEKLQGYMPRRSYEILKNAVDAGRAPADTAALDGYITGLLRLKGAEGIKKAPYCGEGLENRIYRAAMENFGFDAICRAVKTKRYTLSRLKRLLINIAAGLDGSTLEEFVAAGPQYIRVLGANTVGLELLKNARKRASLPIITKTANYKRLGGGLLARMLQQDLRATDLQSLCLPDPALRRGGYDLLSSPVIEYKEQ